MGKSLSWKCVFSPCSQCLISSGECLSSKGNRKLRLGPMLLLLCHCSFQVQFPSASGINRRNKIFPKEMPGAGSTLLWELAPT